MLDEFRNALVLLPENLHLPEGRELQPVLPHHYPAPGRSLLPSPSPAARAAKAARALRNACAGQVPCLCPGRTVRCTVTLRGHQAGEPAALISAHRVPLASLRTSADLTGGRPGPGRPWAGMASRGLRVWWLGPWPGRAVVSQHPAADPHGAARARPRPSRVPDGRGCSVTSKGLAIRRVQKRRTSWWHLPGWHLPQQ